MQLSVRWEGDTKETAQMHRKQRQSLSLHLRPTSNTFADRAF
jgi:hypothetical protein